MPCGVKDPSGIVSCDMAAAGHTGLHTGIRSTWFGLQNMRIYWGKTTEQSAAGYKRPMPGVRSYDNKAWLSGDLPTNPLAGFSVSSSGSTLLTEGVWTDLTSRTIVGTGRGAFTYNWSFNHNGFQWLSYVRELRLLVDGTEISHPTRSSTGVWTSSTNVEYDLEEGMVVTLQAYSSGTSYAECRTVTSWALSLAVL